MLDNSNFVPATFSECRTWRYSLRRRWSAGAAVGFVLLNPSTADETLDDPTIRRCIGYAKAWGFGGLVLGNMFAFRATDPKDMKAATDPVGPDNDAWLLRICEEAGGHVVCGWGSHGGYLGRSAKVRADLLRAGVKPQALKLTSAGEPGHPLYLRGDLQPFAMGL